MVLIVGGDSTIGLALSCYWEKRKIPFHSSTRHKELKSDIRPFIDLTRIHTFKNLSNYRVAVICAAVTDMAICERQTKKTKSANVTGTIELIKVFCNNNTHILFLSTNQVFDGEKPCQYPDSTRNPINDYGRQKADVEKFLENVTNTCILRLTKVIHPELKLLKQWQRILSAGDSIVAFDDMTLSPVHLDDVIIKIDLLIRDKAIGIYQLSGKSDISYYDFARHFAEKNGYSPKRVKKDTWKGKLEYEPPKYTSMVNV